MAPPAGLMVSGEVEVDHPQDTLLLMSRPVLPQGLPVEHLGRHTARPGHPRPPHHLRGGLPSPPQGAVRRAHRALLRAHAALLPPQFPTGLLSSIAVIQRDLLTPVSLKVIVWKESPAYCLPDWTVMKLVRCPDPSCPGCSTGHPPPPPTPRRTRCRHSQKNQRLTSALGIKNCSQCTIRTPLFL